MNRIKSASSRVTNHVKTHKFAYAMTTVSILLLVGNTRNLNAFSEFLIEKGIDPLEFSNPEYYAELHPQ